MDPNDELRRILEAGPPKDGNYEPLWKGLYEARFHVPLALRHWEFTIVGHNDDKGYHAAAYTHLELAPKSLAEWRLKWVRAGIREISEHALALGSASLRINPGHYSFELNYEAMTAAASGVGWGPEGSMVMFDVVTSWVGKLDSRFPDAVTEEWRRLAKKHKISKARLAGVRLGKMPMAASIAYEPPRNERFERECHEALHRVFSMRLIFSQDRSFSPELSVPISEDAV